LQGYLTSALISEDAPDTAEVIPRISPAPATPRRNLLPSDEFMEIFTLPSSKNRTFWGACSSPIKTVAAGQSKRVASDAKSLFAWGDKSLKNSPDPQSC
jgi:hypothetical protein